MFYLPSNVAGWVGKWVSTCVKVRTCVQIMENTLIERGEPYLYEQHFYPSRLPGLTGVFNPKERCFTEYEQCEKIVGPTHHNCTASKKQQNVAYVVSLGLSCISTSPLKLTQAKHMQKIKIGFYWPTAIN